MPSSKGFSIIFSKISLKDLRKIPKSDQRHILKFLEEKLLTNPYQFGSKLSGKLTAGQRKFRVGVYRIRFDIIENQIFIYRIRHRKEVYRDA